jgi:hypothetical protein
LAERTGEGLAIQPMGLRHGEQQPTNAPVEPKRRQSSAGLAGRLTCASREADLMTDNTRSQRHAATEATSPYPRRLVVAIFVATVAQLLLATFVPGLPQFDGKNFGARLVAYPAMMLFVPAMWVLRRRYANGSVHGEEAPPWPAFALVMAPFLIDVTGNSLDLYDTVGWWDDANHAVNWFLLCAGIGLLLRGAVRPAWALGVLIAGIGALLAVGWEVGEWYAFIRGGTELATAYEDTLFDEVLGSLGAAAAGVVIARRPVRGCAAASTRRCP